MNDSLELSPLEPESDAGEGTAGAGPTERSDSVDAGTLAGTRASLLDELRQRRERLLEADPRMTLDLPNYDGHLFARFCAPRWLDSKEIRDRWRVSDHPKAELYAYADLLAVCCTEIVGVDDQGAHVPLAEGTVRFMEAARLLGSQPSSDREAVFALMSEVQVHAAYVAFDAWTLDAAAAADADIAGKSRAATSS